MVVRKCGKCGAVWRSELSQCAFCGVEGEDLGRPETAVDVLPPPPVNGSAQEPGTKQTVCFVPPAPGLPSAVVPLAFGALGLTAAALLPLAAWMPQERTADVLLCLGIALFAPFAPLAWGTGARYEARCDVLGFRPSAAARAGRFLGLAVTLILAAEGSALAFLRALARLQQ